MFPCGRKFDWVCAGVAVLKWFPVWKRAKALWWRVTNDCSAMVRRCALLNSVPAGPRVPPPVRLLRVRLPLHPLHPPWGLLVRQIR